jgi:hypothetical protein
MSRRHRVVSLAIVLGLIMVFVFVSLSVGLFSHQVSNVSGQQQQRNVPQASVTSTAAEKILGLDQIAYNPQSFIDSLKTNYNVSWSRESVSIGQYWTLGDYESLLQAHIQILGSLAEFLFQNNSWTLSNWDAAVSIAVNNYPDIHVWEIYNEPQYFNSGYMCCDKNVTEMAQHYFNMLRDAYRIIKAHNQSDIVLAFGGADVAFGYNVNTFTLPFAEEVWSLGGANYCDAISLHAYSKPYLLNQTLPRNEGLFNQTAFPTVNPTYSQVWTLGLQKAEALTSKPIWITETGMPSDTYIIDNGTTISGSTQLQAAFVQQAYSLFAGFPYIKGVFWYSTYGISELPVKADCGLFYLNTYQPKPAMDAYEAFVSTS